ncbi:MAG: phage head-tail connector protein [Desulfamplus sp.]|nr:phage head-tail connector protein [Desulfamplus sp.]
MDLKLITAPTASPIDATDLKYHLRLDGTDHDLYIPGLIEAGTKRVELFTNRKLVTQTWEIYGKSFKDIIDMVIPLGQTQSIVSVKYADSDGVEQTVSSDEYALIFPGCDGAKITFDTGYALPDVSWDGCVTVRFVCGYGAASAVPDTIKSAIRLVCGDLFDGRDNGRAIESLLAPYKLHFFS